LEARCDYTPSRPNSRKRKHPDSGDGEHRPGGAKLRFKSLPQTYRQKGWERLPRDIQIYILGFQQAADAMRLRPTSKLFATSGIEHLRSPNAAACMIAQKHGLRFLFVKELHLHRQVPIFNGGCFPALEILELHTWYTSEVVSGEWASLKTVNCYGSGNREAVPWNFFSPDFNCPECLTTKMRNAYDITLPGRGFPKIKEVTLERCASFTLADVSPEQVDPDGFDDEMFNDWHVPSHAWDQVGEWTSVERIRVVKPGYGIALACVFPNLTVVEVEQSTGEPVLLAGKFPKLREIHVDSAKDVLLTGEFSPKGRPQVIVRNPPPPPLPD